MAISGSVDSTTSLVYGLYVPHKVLNTPQSIAKVIKYRFELSNIHEPIRAKSIIFYYFAKLRHWRFSDLAITRKVKI